MKTTFFSLLVLFQIITMSINAQLKVNSNGSLWQGYNGYANIAMGTYPAYGYNYGEWGIEVSNGCFNIWRPWPCPNNGNYFLYIMPSGNVGIGKVPSYKLDVNGDIATYGTLRISSDARLKTDIKALSGKTELLYLLNGKSYKKNQPEDEQITSKRNSKVANSMPEKKFSKTNKTKTETTEYGFIAQELKEVYPDLVSQDSAGYYTVDYIGLIPILVEAVKEQQIQIDELISKTNGTNSFGNKKANSISSTSETSIDVLSYPVLEQNAPNPFSTLTVIDYYLPISIVSANIYIYDMNGKQLKSISLSERGKGKVTIQGNELDAGMYLYTLITDGKVIDTKRMVLTK